jgi:hypothetical protein
MSAYAVRVHKLHEVVDALSGRLAATGSVLLREIHKLQNVVRGRRSERRARVPYEWLPPASEARDAQ